MPKKIKIVFLGSATFLLPLVAFATEVSDLGDLLELISDYFVGVAPLLVAMAIAYFLWGVLKFVGSGDSEDKRKEGRNVMINGIIAIFVMVSIWGLVAFLVETFGLEDGSGSALDAPELDSISW